VSFERPDRRSAKWRTYDADVLPLWIAEMDYPLAPCIAAALHDAVDRSDTGYRFAADLPQALSEFWARRIGWAPDPDRIMLIGDVLVGMAESLRRLSAGALVITPPAYPPFFHVAVDLVGRDLVEVPLIPGEGLDFDGLATAFARPEVTTFLLGNPHNPTGDIWSADDLRRIAELAREYDVLVISDEIWAPLTMPGKTMTPYLSLGEELTGPDVALVSASKAFNLAGLKAAQMIAGSDATMERIRAAIPLEISYSTGQFGVIASIAAFRDGDAWLDDTRAQIASNADLLATLLAESLPQVHYTPPEATYLAWLDFRELGLGDDPAAVLLERGRVALSTGPAFGEQGKGWARLNLATTPEIISEAVTRMLAAMP